MTLDANDKLRRLRDAIEQEIMLNSALSNGSLVLDDVLRILRKKADDLLSEPDPVVELLEGPSAAYQELCDDIAKTKEQIRAAFIQPRRETPTEEMVRLGILGGWEART